VNRFLANAKIAILTVAIATAYLLQGLPAQAQGEQVVTVAGGCFWCVEADFERVPGVREVVSGYTGGTTPNPTYRQVTSGGTGHYEAVQIFFDPGRISERQIYDLFLRSIDPFDAGGQFCDRGESYRTAIFVTDNAQRSAATAAKAAAEAALGRSIVTPILEAAPFYEAEDYHQNYYLGRNIVVTRGGPMRQSAAYDFYREGCGRDARVQEIWGDAAPFIKN